MEKKLSPAGENSSLTLKKVPLRKIKIRFRLMVSFLILSIVPLLSIGILAVIMSGNAVENKIESYSSELLKATGDYVDLQTSRILDINKEIILSDLIQKDLPILDKMDDIARNQTAQSIERLLTNKFIKDDNIVCSVIIAGDKVFKYGSTNILTAGEWEEISKRITENGGGAKEFKTLCLARKLDHSNVVIYGNNMTEALTGGQLGMMVTVIDEKYLSESYQNVRIAEGSDVYVVDQEGIKISGTGGEELGQALKDDALPEKIKESAQKNTAFRRNDALVSAKLLNPSGWYLVSEIPYSYLYRESRTIENYVILSVGLCLILSLAAAWWITGSITNPLYKLTGSMKKAEEGNLTLSIRDTNKDEVAGLFGSFNQMLDNIRLLMQNVRTSAKQVTDGASEVAVSADQSYKFSQQIAETVQQIADGSTNQASNTVESVRHMGSLAHDIIEVGNIMKGVSESLEKTRAMNESIRDHIGLLSEKAMETSEITGKVVNDITDLNTDMQEIGKITRMIESVSEQTRLLSLNAAIEAARAGEAGRGFAVVAEEVGKLSDQSRNASKAIAGLLEGIRAKTQKTADRAGSAIRIVDEQTEAVGIANASFKDIFKSMESIIAFMDRMSQCVDKMMLSKDKASEAMENISSVAEEFAATAQEVSASTEEHIAGSEKLSRLAKNISGLAVGLDRLISNFKID